MSFLNLPPMRIISPHNQPLPRIPPGFSIMDPASNFLPVDHFQEHPSALYQTFQNCPSGTLHEDLARRIVETENLMTRRGGGPPLVSDELAQQNQNQQPQVPVAASAFLAAARQDAPSPIPIHQPPVRQNNDVMNGFENSWAIPEVAPQEIPPQPISQDQMEAEMVPQEDDFDISEWWNDDSEDDEAALQSPAQLIEDELEQIESSPPRPQFEVPLPDQVQAQAMLEEDADMARILDEMREEPHEHALAPRGAPPFAGFRVKRERSVSVDFNGSSSRELQLDHTRLLVGASLAGAGQKRIRNSDLPDIFGPFSMIPEEQAPKVEDLQDPEDIKIQELFNSIRPDMDISAADRTAIKTPAALNIELKDYQKLGFAWLKKMELSNACGGVLADDMGLGKTVQTLALIADHRPKGNKTKSTLVSHTTLLVTPKSLLKQWQAEILSKVKQTEEHRLSVLIYHGETRKKDIEVLHKYDVVITTYGVVSSEFKLHNAGKKDKLVILGSKAQFFRCVLDEAQTIKNRLTQMSQGCCLIKAKYRLCLSGTPMQNHVQELFPLFKFLRVPKYLEWSNFNHAFVSGSDPTKMQRLKALLCTLMLRRHKLSTLDGKPMITLPEKHVHIINIPLSDEEKRLYNEMEVRTRGQYRQIMRDGSIENKYTQILVLLLRLRQIACHHYLTPSYIGDQEVTVTEDKDGNIIIPPFINHVMGKFKDETIKRVIESNILSEQECPICFEPQEGNRTDILFPCGHSLCVDCIVQLRESKALENRQNGRIEEAESGVVNCPTCREKVRGKDSIVDLKLFTAWCHRNGKIPKQGLEDDDDSDADNWDTISKVKANANAISLPPTPPKGHDPLRGRPWVSSSKVDKCIEILESIAAKGDEKTLIFSQFTSLLDLLSHALNLASIPFGRFDGSMHETARSAAINNFQTNPDAKVLLISIKAGNTGLNLIQASQVIMMDPMYNPYVEHQAVDRAHRIGQQRDVTIHRLIAEGTIEDRILKRQEEKIGIVEEALQEGKGNGNGGKLKPEELKYLLFGKK